MNLLTKKISKTFSFTYPCPRKLRQIMKISIIQRQPTQTIQNIWTEYHKNRPQNISAVLDKNEYTYLRDSANRAPMFLIPIKRKGGHFKLLSQWQTNSFLLTYLQDFKVHGGNAAPYLVFTFFTQLLFTKGIVLVRGDIISYKLTKIQSNECYECLKRSYQTPQINQMMVNFNHNTSAFNMNKYNQIFNL